MGRLCGGAHEILGIKAPGGWVVLWVMGWVELGVMGGWEGGVVGPHDTPHHGGLSDTSMLFLTIW